MHLRQRPIASDPSQRRPPAPAIRMPIGMVSHWSATYIIWSAMVSHLVSHQQAVAGEVAQSAMDASEWMVAAIWFASPEKLMTSDRQQLKMMTGGGKLWESCVGSCVASCVACLRWALRIVSGGGRGLTKEIAVFSFFLLSSFLFLSPRQAIQQRRSFHPRGSL